MESMTEIRKTVHHDVQIQQHSSARAVAESIHAAARGYLRRGLDRRAVYVALNTEYVQQRESGNAIIRDALAEVLDALDGLSDEESAL
jgi:hypothetical protein